MIESPRKVHLFVHKEPTCQIAWLYGLARYVYLFSHSADIWPEVLDDTNLPKGTGVGNTTMVWSTYWQR